jgi:hypothetical protein
MPSLGLGLSLGKPAGPVGTGGSITVAVDLLYRPSAGTPGSLITLANIQSGTVSADTWTWVKNNAGAIDHTYLRTDAQNLPVTLTCNGTTISSVANALQFDMALSTGGTTLDEFRVDPAVTRHDTSLIAFLKFNATATLATDVSIDCFVMQSPSDYTVPEWLIRNPSENGTQGHIVAHNNSGKDSASTAAIPTNTLVVLLALYDWTSGNSQAVLLDGTTLAVIGCSYKPGMVQDALNSILMQDYISPVATDYRVYAVGVMYTTPSITPFAITVPVPTVPSATQTNINEATFTWSGIAMTYKVERSSNGGGSWSTLAASQRASSYVDSTVVDATTYLYRTLAPAIVPVTSKENFSPASKVTE